MFVHILKGNMFLTIELLLFYFYLIPYIFFSAQMLSFSNTISECLNKLIDRVWSCLTKNHILLALFKNRENFHINFKTHAKKYI